MNIYILITSNKIKKKIKKIFLIKLIELHGAMLIYTRYQLIEIKRGCIIIYIYKYRQGHDKVLSNLIYYYIMILKLYCKNVIKNCSLY